ncbi:MAG: M14 family metallopeptidase [Floccifex porci]|uniref:M14 family metallopeptidase n=1 Tax=Floccifex porci TaxID=2606629 RepID=UPI002A823364|nr:M14 family metallopeptidase [Floccifex porci]MDY4796402.1 M14 family metallopeptidase [Floccifex porci]
MKEKCIYEIESLYRDSFKIRSFEFGQGEQTLYIVGSLRGNEVQQMYICSLIIETLKQLEIENYIKEGYKIIIVPCANPYSMNQECRFWPSDGTDINRMFPGYDAGETTQRIADGLFNKINQCTFGIQLTSFYIPGQFSTHIRMMKTGLEDIEEAKHFGLSSIVVRDPRPYDTTTLNYNWQIWNCKAYSLYTRACEQIDEKTAQEAKNAVLRFMFEKHMISYPFSGGYKSEIIEEKDMISIKSKKAGILKLNVDVDEYVQKDQTLARIYDPYIHTMIETIQSTCKGKIFFVHAKSLVYSHTAVVKIKKEI